MFRITKLLLALLLVTTGVSAEERAPITIEADRMELNQQQGTSLYHGNVVLQQGKLQLKADTLTLYSSNNHLQRAVITGNPATLKQQGAEGEEPVRARAEWMEYLPAEKRINLRGAAQLWRNGSEFNGEEISYDLSKKQVKASGDKASSGESRVRVILQPETKEEQQ